MFRRKSMARIRRKFSAEFKSKVALAAIREDRTLAELAGQYQVHPHQVTAWKRQALAVLPEVFSRKRDQDAARQRELLDELYGQIGRLKVELDWVKKKSGLEPGA
jgi:transposase-like protein